MTLTEFDDRTAAAPAKSESESPPRKPSRFWRRPGVLGGLGVLAVLAAVIVLTLLATDSSKGGDLDPRSADPTGTLALAELLRARGIDSSRGATARPGGTLVVPFAGRLDPAELGRILDRSGPASRVVLLSPGDLPDDGLMESKLQGVSVRDPECDLAAAVAAGSARVGGHTYTGPSTSCYGGSIVLAERGATPLVVLGSSTFLTNDELDKQGNAALAIGLLSGAGLPGNPSTSVVWYQPVLDPQANPPGLIELLPDSVPWAVLQLVLAVALVALWRGRRLGPVVEEPLPVIVPAAETVEGRARLYAAGRARGAAADAIRTGARARLGGALDQGGEPDPGGLIATVAQRSGRQPGEIAALLYGSAGPVGPDAGPSARLPGEIPADDSALVRLVDEIDRLEREVRTR